MNIVNHLQEHNFQISVCKLNLKHSYTANNFTHKRPIIYASEKKIHFFTWIAVFTIMIRGYMYLNLRMTLKFKTHA